MKVEVNGKTYCVETLIADNERLRKDVIAGAELHRLILDNLRAEIADMPKLYPFIDHIDTYVKEDDVLAIIDKYRNEVNHDTTELPDNMCTQRCCLKNHNIGIIECNEECYNRTLL